LIPEAYTREEDLEAFAQIAASCFSLFHLAMFLMTPNLYNVSGVGDIPFLLYIAEYGNVFSLFHMAMFLMTPNLYNLSGVGGPPFLCTICT
jgi:hypothetical protein